MGEAAAWTVPRSFPSRETPEVQLLMESPQTLFGLWWSGVLVTMAPTSPPHPHPPGRQNSCSQAGQVSVEGRCGEKGPCQPTAHSDVYSQCSEDPGLKPKNLTESRSGPSRAPQQLRRPRPGGGLEDTRHKIILPPLSVRVTVPTGPAACQPTPDAGCGVR